MKIKAGEMYFTKKDNLKAFVIRNAEKTFYEVSIEGHSGTFAYDECINKGNTTKRPDSDLDLVKPYIDPKFEKAIELLTISLEFFEHNKVGMDAQEMFIEPIKKLLKH